MDMGVTAVLVNVFFNLEAGFVTVQNFREFGEFLEDEAFIGIGRVVHHDVAFVVNLYNDLSFFHVGLLMPDTS
jgi:hypothetical protein